MTQIFVKYFVANEGDLFYLKGHLFVVFQVSGPVQAADSSTGKPRQSTVKLPAINGSSSASGSKS